MELAIPAALGYGAYRATMAAGDRLFGTNRQIQARRAFNKRRYAGRISRFSMSKRRKVGRHQYRTGGVNNLELKAITTIHGGTLEPFAGSPLLVSVCRIAQGTTDTTRVGNQCTLSSVSFRWCFESKAGTQDNTYRVMLLYDAQPNGTLAAASDILDSPITTLAHNNLDGRLRFTTLFNSGVFELGDAASGNMKNGICAEVFVKNCQLGQQYNGVGAAVGDLVTGNLLILVVGSGPSAAAAHVFLFEIRGRFTDGRIKDFSKGFVTVKRYPG